MKYIKGLILFLIIALSACEKQGTGVNIDLNDSLSFIGNFTFASSLIQNDTVNLIIQNRKYECYTRLPYGIGAGELKFDDKTIEFVDTLFFIIPALYGPTYVLSGKYKYQFNGKELIIRKDFSEGHDIEYYLKLTKSN